MSLRWLAGDEQSPVVVVDQRSRTAVDAVSPPGLVLVAAAARLALSFGVGKSVSAAMVISGLSSYHCFRP